MQPQPACSSSSGPAAPTNPHSHAAAVPALDPVQPSVHRLALLSRSPRNSSHPQLPFSTRHSELIYEARDKNNLNLNRRLMGQFRRSLDKWELIDFALQNRRYTWSNERVEPTLVRLDRMFYNKEWDLTYSGYTLQALSSSLSDHCPLLLCQQARPRKQ
jgi:hypothetical protein